MCFSATSSFVMAGLVGATGIATLGMVRSRREWLLASFPMIFATQQAVEGFVWMTLDAQASCAVTNTFILYAEVLWPICAPLAVFLVEPDRRRSRGMMSLLIIALMLVAYFVSRLLVSPYQAFDEGNHIRYQNEFDYPIWAFAVYFLVSCGPFLISSHRSLRQFGLFLVLGIFVSGYFYWRSFISVWCFFAAGLSVLVYYHFVQTRAQNRGDAYVGEA